MAGSHVVCFQVNEFIHILDLYIQVIRLNTPNAHNRRWCHSIYFDMMGTSIADFLMQRAIGESESHPIKYQSIQTHNNVTNQNRQIDSVTFTLCWKKNNKTKIYSIESFAMKWNQFGHHYPGQAQNQIQPFFKQTNTTGHFLNLSQTQSVHSPYTCRIITIILFYFLFRYYYK